MPLLFPPKIRQCVDTFILFFLVTPADDFIFGKAWGFDLGGISRVFIFNTFCGGGGVDIN